MIAPSAEAFVTHIPGAAHNQPGMDAAAKAVGKGFGTFRSQGSEQFFLRTSCLSGAARGHWTPVILAVAPDPGDASMAIPNLGVAD